MIGRCGTIFEVLKTKAVRHRVPEATWETVCGIDLSHKLPCSWGPRNRWNIDHDKKFESRCKKCYPHQTKRRPWRTKKK